MTPLLLAEGHDPFQHTWNTWVIDLFGFRTIDLRSIPHFEQLGITNAVVMMWVVALLLVLLGVKAGNEAKRALAEGRTPRGIAHGFEVVVAFIRDEHLRREFGA